MKSRAINKVGSGKKKGFRAMVGHLLRTEWRSGDLRLLFAALFLAVAVVTGLTAFMGRLQVMLVGQSNELLAADRVISSPSPIAPEWLARAAELGLRQSKTLLFQSMLFNDKNAEAAPQLVSAKAADAGYPLRGTLLIRQAGQTVSAQQGPQAGEIWLEGRLFTLLGLSVGDTVLLGDARLKLTQELVSEPDRGAGFTGLGPRALMHWSDIEKTNVVQLGSRLRYRYLFAGDVAALKRLEDYVKPLLGESEEWRDIESAQPTVSKALERAKTFFMLASSVIVILASLAVAMASSRFSQRHMRQVAVMKTLGATSAYITRLYAAVLAVTALIATLLAWLVAYAAQALALAQVGVALKVAPPTLTLWPFALGLATTLVSLVAFALPPLLSLRRVSALTVLQERHQSLKYFSTGALIGALASLLGLLLLYTEQPWIGLFLLAGLLALLLLVTVPVAWFLRASKRVSSPSLAWGNGALGFDVWWPLAWSNLRRRARANALYIALFAMSMMLLLLLLGVKNHLFDQWHQQLPAKTPNHFIANVLETDLPALQKWIKGNQIASEPLYPMVRGRLVKINQTPVRELVSKEEVREAGADRELNLSWSPRLPTDNLIQSGTWLEGEAATGHVSVESRLAERLGIKLGDDLTFLIEAQEITAKVSSLREVQWDRMRPNFYMLLSEEQLAPFSKTFMTSFWIEPGRSAVTTQLLRDFPTFIVIELEAIIAQIKNIVGHVAMGLQGVLYLVMAGSVLVLLTTVLNGLDERQRENTILRAMGASRKLIVGSLVAEFALMGLLAGVLATVLAQVVLMALQVWVLKMPMALIPAIWWQAPFFGMVLIGLAGYLSARHTSNVAPMQLLRLTG